jgi:hypothetical protein
VVVLAAGNVCVWLLAWQRKRRVWHNNLEFIRYIYKEERGKGREERIERKEERIKRREE